MFGHSISVLNCFMLYDYFLLSKQVLQVVKKTESLKRISFLAHSLGGLFARYAIAVLYSHDAYNKNQPGDLAHSTAGNSQSTSFSKGGMIAGLEPINFITLASPHLGVRGKRQVCSGPYKYVPMDFLPYINFSCKWVLFVLAMRLTFGDIQTVLVLCVDDSRFGAYIILPIWTNCGSIIGCITLHLQSICWRLI